MFTKYTKLMTNKQKSQNAISRLEGSDQYMKDRKIYYTGEMKRQRSNDATGKMSFN